MDDNDGGRWEEDDDDGETLITFFSAFQFSSAPPSLILSRQKFERGKYQERQRTSHIPQNSFRGNSGVHDLMQN